MKITKFVEHRRDLTVDKNRDPSTRRREDKDGGGGSATEKRFAYSLLEKLLEYVDKAAYNMKQTKPASKFSRRHSYSTATEDVKFFGKVCLHKSADRKVTFVTCSGSGE